MGNSMMKNPKSRASPESRISGASPKEDWGAKDALATDSGDPPALGERSVELGHTFVRSSYAGPLPPPDWLEKYEGTLKGAAHRILKMVENGRKWLKKTQMRLARVKKGE